jgi:thioredoxin 2
MATFTVTCRACGAVNRIPAGREGQSGRCGKCRAALPPLYFRPRPLTERSFDPFLKSYPGPVLAEFWAPW